MPGLADMMSEKYGDKSEEKDEAAGTDEEGSRLGSKLASAVKSGDGEMIYNAFAALHAHCGAEEMGK